MTFNNVLEKYRSVATSERDKGDRFERLIQAYLYTDPKYTHLKKVWLWNEFPYRKDFGNQDIGIDLVAQTTEGDYWAIQCKCYREDARISKEEVDTFLSTSGRSFVADDDKRVKFSHRLWVSTTNNWSAKADETLLNQDPQVNRLNLAELEAAPVEWDKIDEGIFGEKARTAKKELRSHQREALSKTIEYFKQKDRGKLIMACGTGKTFTSLRIAEAQAGNNGTVLFLVPSIALLGQTLREWTGDAKEDINSIAICSDAEITTDMKKNEDAETYSMVDLALPASTNVNDILKQFELFEMTNRQGMTVVFSTYQSIEVIARTQKRLESIGSRYAKFDIIICDEAHRTTGVTLQGDDESSFVKVHDNEFISSDKRLYMTATPRLYGDESKRKAEETSATICSMDNVSQYGEEIYRIGFGMAVERGLLSDYKVLILTLSENDITPEVQQAIQNSEHEISFDDASKLIGCINAMSKQIIGDKGTLNANDPEPMRRAVAFTPSIKSSKKITNTFNGIGDTYFESVPALKQESLVNLRSKHIDGSMSATKRDELMSWLKAEPENSSEARVLTNVRCLSEGVDVPSLDAVMFLSARNSQVDVVQSVGRVMRKSPGKEYGYIIIPIVVPTDVKPEDALNDNERYKVVWTVLNALRAHDDRFNAIINKIDLNKTRPEQVMVGRPDPDGDGDPFNDTEKSKTALAEVSQTSLYFNELQNAIYAKLVQKVGEREYWENWAKDIADVAERQVKRITKVVDEDDAAHMAFREFVRGLRKNINPSISDQQAIEMLSQHIITKPVFEALFEGYSFVQNNAVSVSMQQALDAIETRVIAKEDAELLDSFYKSVRRRAEGIDNSEGKQRIIVELYEKFFKSAFPKMVEQLGIVYTPVEVVDFIVHSVNDVLQKEFGRSLSDKNVNILDPFTGTGTFVTRILQSGIIKPEDLERKYKHEIFANEIVLLAYYIAAVNIESAYHDLLEKNEYESFEGIVLTDTFQLAEDEDNSKLFSNALAENSERLQRQKDAPLRVIIGNPPYSAGQKSANDNAQNQKYTKLDSRIERTYARESEAGLKNSLYDPYIKAIRWATDRLGDDGGIVGFVSNGSWIDANSQDGMRKSLAKEFSSIYVFNLRGRAIGNSGEHRRREAGNVFGGGTRTPITITIFVRDPKSSNQKADIYYHDIGDYLKKEQKLKIIADFGSVSNDDMGWEKLIPNEHGDWIGQRNDLFKTFYPSDPEKKFSSNAKSLFTTDTSGLTTSRDAWCFNTSKDTVETNIKSSIDFFNAQSKNYTNRDIPVDKYIDYDPTKISWDRQQVKDVKSNKTYAFNKSSVRKSMYRPYFKQFVYFDRQFNNCVYQLPKLFPRADVSNLIILTSGRGGSKDFSVLITNLVPCYDTLDKTHVFPLYYYEKAASPGPALFDTGDEELTRYDAVSDYILMSAKNQYADTKITKEDIFYYVYGLLHSPDYRDEFSNDLKKTLARIPLVQGVDNFRGFSSAGRELAELHLDYEKFDPPSNVKVSGTQHANYIVDPKMKFGKKSVEADGKKKNVDDKSVIYFNDQITIDNIPENAYGYVVNGKSAIEWILDRYQVRKEIASGIVNDPNDWAIESGNPRYILDLLLSVITVSIKTVAIVDQLPELSFQVNLGITD